MKHLLLKQLRDFKKSLFVNISVFLITLTGMFFFSGLIAVGGNIGNGIDEFYLKQNLADFEVGISSGLAATEVDDIRNELCADGAMNIAKTSFVFGDKTRNIAIYVFPHKDFRVNIPNVTQGKMPEYPLEALIDRAFAEANTVRTGDRLTLPIKNKKYEITVCGLAEFPEHLYKGTKVPELESTAILKVYLPDSGEGSAEWRDVFSVDRLFISTALDAEELRGTLANITGQSQLSANIYSREEMVSVARIRADIELITSLMNILPVICFVALCLILFINMSKRIEDESYNIGVISAFGIKKSKIIISYLLPVFLWVMIGGVIGASLGVTLLPPVYISLLERFYTLPTIAMSGIAFSAIIPLLVLAAITALALFSAIARIIGKTPNELMRGKTKNSVKVLKGSKLPLTFVLAVRNFLSYKKKSIFTILSCALCLALLLTAFLLDNSVDNLQNTVYGRYYNYDATIEWNTMDKLDYESVKEDVIGSGLFRDAKFCIDTVARDPDGDRTVSLTIIDGDDPCYNIYDGNKKIEFGDTGVYIPRSFGKVENVNLRIDYLDISYTLSLPVAGSYDDIGTFGIFLPIAALQKTDPMAYGALKSGKMLTQLYVSVADADESELEEYMSGLREKYLAAFLFVRHSPDGGQFSNLFIVLDITDLILFVVCGIIMALMIINISCLSISDRVRDYTIFKALGLGTEKINFLNSLENYISVFFAILLSIPIGLVITENIIDVVIKVTSVFVYLHLYWWSIIILLAGALLFTAVSNVLINRKISGVNITTALKIKE